MRAATSRAALAAVVASLSGVGVLAAVATVATVAAVAAVSTAMAEPAATQPDPTSATGHGAPVGEPVSEPVSEIARYREMLADGNPAELWEDAGKALWARPAGPRQVSLEQCDLGRGPGVTRGAYAELPRYFADADTVMDLEQRLAWCRMTLQGLTRAEAHANPFGSAGNPSDIERLVAFIAGQSRGLPMRVGLDHPREQRAYRLGEALFFYRAGAYDFACATCHAADGQRIRLQDLPNLLESEGARRAYTSWPAYRISQGEVRSMQHRLYDCLRQQRFPAADYGSEAITALTTYLARNANGGIYDGPGLKR